MAGRGGGPAHRGPAPDEGFARELTPRILLLNLGHFSTHLVLLLFPVVAALAADAFAESYGRLLALSTGCFVLYGLGALPAGWLADRWSRRGMIAVYFFGTGLACILTGFAQSYWQIAAALMLVGLLASIYHPVGVSMLAGEGGAVGRRLGINGVWGNAGVAVSTLAAGWLADQFGWRAAFWVPGLGCILLGVLWLRATRGLRERAARADSGVAGMLAPGWKRVLVIVLITAVFTGFIFNAATVSLPKVLDERIAGIASSAAGIGTVAMVIYLIAAISQIVVGHAIDRWPVKPIFIAISVAQAGVLLLASQADGLAMIALAIVMMVLVYGELPIADVLIARNAPGTWRSRVYATSYLIGFLASASAVPAIAFLYEGGGGFAALFLVCALGAAIVAAIASTLPGGRPGPAAAAAAGD